MPPETEEAPLSSRSSRRVEADMEDETKIQQEPQSSNSAQNNTSFRVAQSRERLGNRAQINESPSACFVKQLFNPNASQLEEHRKKSWPNYTSKAQVFAFIVLFSTYMSTSPTSVAIKISVVVDILVFLIIVGVLIITLPDWGNALVCISWFLLEVAVCLVIIPFNGRYTFAIFLVLCLILLVARLQPLLFPDSSRRCVLLPISITDAHALGDQENDYLNHLFDISNAIATGGGMVTSILAYKSYMEGPLTPAGFFFVSTVFLGLYLMMVTTTRVVSPPHAACLTVMLILLLLVTVITGAISFVATHHSVTM